MGTATGSALYYGPDQLGSVRDTLVAPNGLRAAHFDIDPYGNITANLGIASGKPDMRYAGLFYHKHSGLYLATYRAYNPVVGQWMSRDPIEEADGINLYGYIGGDPLNLRDPLGLSWQSNTACFLSGAGAGAGGALVIGGAPIVAGALGAPVVATTAAFFALGVAGGIIGFGNAVTAYNSGNFDALAYIAGNVVGGLSVGGGLARSITGVGADPFFQGELPKGYDPSYPNGSLSQAFGKGRTAAGALGAARGAIPGHNRGC